MSAHDSRTPKLQPDAGTGSAEAPARPHVQVGWVVSAERGSPIVDYPGSAGPVRARSTSKMSAEELLSAAANRQGAVLLFEERNPGSPILVGLLQPASETPLLDQLLGEPAVPPAEAPRTALDDGKRVLIEGKDEVVLQCGEASITLRRNGRVVIRGTSLETRASGIHRIRGGKVEIN